MLTWLLMIIVLAILVVIFTVVFAKLFGRGEEQPPLPANNDILEFNRSVLLKGSVDDLVFDTVFRGYRQDQVDDVVMELKAEIDSLVVQLEGKELS